MSTDATHPVVFLSYSHDSEDHRTRVRQLATRLEKDGIDCRLDQWREADGDLSEAWPTWMDRQLDEAAFILLIATEGYYRKAKGEVPKGTGHGVRFESVLMIQDLYEAGMLNERLLPTLFDAADSRWIVRPLRGYRRYRVDTDRRYETLLRRLLGRPRYGKPEPGEPPDLPPEDTQVWDPASESQRFLLGEVYHLGENEEPIHEPGLPVLLRESRQRVETDDQGLFRVALPEHFQTGEAVTLTVDKPEWRIRYPLEGRVSIPLDLRRLVPIELLPVGSKLFWTHDRIERFIQDLAESSKQAMSAGAEEREVDFSQTIAAWAQQYGFTPDRVREEIEEWARQIEEGDSEDEHKRGLAAFARKEFEVAAGRFRASAEGGVKRLEDIRRREEELAQQRLAVQGYIVRDYGLAGDSHYAAYRFEEALESYEQALAQASPEAMPQLWAVTQNDIGRAAWELGIRARGDQAQLHLEKAVLAFHTAQKVFTREELPQDWARTQNNLGNALTQQGLRSSGDAGRALLSQAVAAYQAALEVYTREELPQKWATTQNNLGAALQEEGLRSSADAGRDLLSQAVTAYGAALEVRTREELPQAWAMTQNNLGNALREQGLRSSGDAGLALLSQAVAAYQAALEVYAREELPQQWATTQNNLGAALQEEGSRSSGDAGRALLSQAVSAYQAALEVRTREELPQGWAMTQNNLGAALQEEGLRSSGDAGRDLLSQAAAAYQAALEVYTREELPQQWAMTQNNLGAALHEQGLRSSGDAGRALLLQAVAAYQAALEVRTREHMPWQWAMTMRNLAEALEASGQDQEAAAVLAEVEAFERETGEGSETAAEPVV